MIKIIIGCILIGAGIALAAWVGIWLLFIYGIVQVVNGIKATPTDALDIAIGLLRVFMALPVGATVGAMCCAFGSNFIKGAYITFRFNVRS